MERKVASFIKQNHLICAGERVGVAVSGGVDSMSLLFLLKNLGYSVLALHFEHGIRGEDSRADALFVRTFCAKEKIPFLLGSADVPSYARARKMSLEAAGRVLRYQFLLDADVDKVATAHHMDDNAETILMNIARGCGVGGLTGIDLEAGRLIRPFLCLRRADIEAYAKEKSIPYVTDKTNFDMHFVRNRIRHGVMPELEKVNPAVTVMLDRLSENAREYARMIKELADAVPVESKNNEASVDAKALWSLSQPVAAEVLFRMCGIAGSPTDVTRAHIEGMLSLRRTGAEIPVKNGIFAKYGYGRLIIYKKDDRIKDISFCVPLRDKTVFPGGVIKKEKGTVNPHNSDKNCECFGHLPADAVVRTRRPGDVFRPFGSGEKKLKDFLIEKKIPREERDALPLVADGRRIIWVAGVAMSADYAVDASGEGIKLKYNKRQGEP
jgi:tRNA(Ile)-lysidine synthase